jgi:predicted enzyme related to lactoylglutathione lyase
MKTNSAVWFEIYVNDMDRATKFYETVFNVKLETLPTPGDDPMQMKTFPGDMEHYGANGALVKMEGVKAGGNSTLIYFGSADCTTEENQVEKAGGKIFKPKMSIGEYGFISLFFDTEGNMVGVHSIA